ncbi:MAG: transglutaminase family protein, partial [Pseudomonadota bacterium]
FSRLAPGAVKAGLQQLRLRPRTNEVQTINDWQVSVEGGTIEAAFEDQHKNLVDLVSLETDIAALTVVATGSVQTRDAAGVTAPEYSFAPHWYYRKPTPLTAPGASLEKLAAGINTDTDDISILHAVCAATREAVTYETGKTGTTTTVEDALATGRGVCQDHAHVFIACARRLGFPCRYVSGYLMMNDRVDQEASHAWAEALVEGVGWVGFDVSNAICPDERYVRIATGCDYGEAAPFSGIAVPGGGEQSLIVSVQVQQ